MSRPEKPERRRLKDIKTALVTFVSFALTGGVLLLNGLLLPWNEEGALFALYGACVGFVLALAVSALGLWFMKKNKD